MKKFENVILASDVDGTFIHKNDPIHKRNIEGIKYLVENGGHFLLSTGRNSKDIRIVGAEMLKYTNMPNVLCNGSLLYDDKKDEIINPIYLDNDKLIELISDVENVCPGIGFRATHENGFVIRDNDTYIANDLKRTNFYHLATAVKFEEIKNYKLFKSVFRYDSDTLDRISEYLSKKYGNSFEIYKSYPTILEILPKTVTKAVQLEYIKEQLKDTIPNIEFWCIGDFDNDIDMLKFADYSACPSNSTPAVKKVAMMEVCHCADGAVGEFIEMMTKRKELK